MVHKDVVKPCLCCAMFLAASGAKQRRMLVPHAKVAKAWQNEGCVPC